MGNNMPDVLGIVGKGILLTILDSKILYGELAVFYSDVSLLVVLGYAGPVMINTFFALFSRPW
jgi:hypothetical protein